MKKLLLFLCVLLSATILRADEGMWLLKELNKQSIERMKELGFKFPISKLYSEENPSLKDAVVIFGGGCTGVTVSSQGLVFTNHHCGYGSIQKLSSVEHDYLKDGFVSQSFTEELPANGLTVSFLKQMIDVTDQILKDITPTDSDSERYVKISKEYQMLMKGYESNEFLSARMVPFYSENKYYIVVYEVFKDVRLVFAPPSSIGKFGGETDNWMWPRHTGDFSIFRVYANKQNGAANYSPDNVPYKPKYSVPISIKGYKENDYAMTVGYPGSTERYMTSHGITQMVESTHKPRIEVRGVKQDIWKEAMNASDAVRIKYANKYAGSSNYWKNAIGMNEAIEKQRIIPQKQELEDRFSKWVSADASRQDKYGNVLPSLQSEYEGSMDIVAISTYFNETFLNGFEIPKYASTVKQVLNQKDSDAEGAASKQVTQISAQLSNTYKDYEVDLDRKVMPALLKLYVERVPAEYLPSIYEKIEDEFNGDYDKYAEWVYNNTKFKSMDDLISTLNNDSDKLDSDPVIELANSIEKMRSYISSIANEKRANIGHGNRLFMAGLMEMEANKAFYPDANFTQRLSYGSIKSYSPADAVQYSYYSTQRGIFEKEVPGDPEFDVQPYILDNLKKADFGRYADKSGIMYVNFLSNNDITGGNSGSPVLNKNAELIGLAFDGNWEALSGDITFNDKVQRCINVDIRYALYIVDKVMNCPRIIDELTIKE